MNMSVIWRLQFIQCRLQFLFYTSWKVFSFTVLFHRSGYITETTNLMTVLWVLRCFRSLFNVNELYQKTIIANPQSCLQSSKPGSPVQLFVYLYSRKESGASLRGIPCGLEGRAYSNAGYVRFVLIWFNVTVSTFFKFRFMGPLSWGGPLWFCGFANFYAPDISWYLFFRTSIIFRIFSDVVQILALIPDAISRQLALYWVRASFSGVFWKNYK